MFEPHIPTSLKDSLAIVVDAVDDEAIAKARGLIGEMEQLLHQLNVLLLSLTSLHYSYIKFVI